MSGPLMRSSTLRAAFLCLSFALLIAHASAAEPAAGQRAITHEDVWLSKRVGPPVPSPDGKWVVFSLNEAAYDEKQAMNDLWIVPLDGSAEPRRLTFSRSGESAVAWSADSKRIAFHAKRNDDEASQIYVMDVVGGGEAVRVTQLTNGARSAQFSPDGKMLLFTSGVFPGVTSEEESKRIAEERKKRKYNARVYDTFPIRYWDKWLEDVQPHLFVQPLDTPGAAARDLFAGTKLAAQRGFGGRRTDTGEEHLDGVWAADGQSVVFSATTNRANAAFAFTNNDLFQVFLAGGEPVRMTPATTAKGNELLDSYEEPSFSPDGTRLYANYEKRTDRTYVLTRLASFDWPQMGKPTVVTANFDRSVSSYAVSPDGATVYVLAEEAGHENLWSIPAQGGEAQPIIALEKGVYTELAAPESGPALVARWESSVNPAEVVRIDLDKGTHTPLTGFNVERAAQIDWQSPRHFWFTSRKGRRIHNLVVLPPNFDENKKYPVLALIHGGPHGMWRDMFFLRWNYHLLAKPGYVLVLTNFTGSTGFGEKFAQNIQGDPLQTPGEEINQAVDEAIRQFPFIDASRQCAGGASYGGHLANWLQASTTRYKCLISHAGLVNLESQWGTSDIIYSREVNQGGPVWEQGPVWRKQNPIRYANKFRTPMLVTIGEQDFRVPLNNSLENWSALQRMKVPSRLVVFPDENHWILKGENSKFFYSEIHGWLKQYLGSDSPQQASN